MLSSLDPRFREAIVNALVVMITVLAKEPFNFSKASRLARKALDKQLSGGIVFREDEQFAVNYCRSLLNIVHQEANAIEEKDHKNEEILVAIEKNLLHRGVQPALARAIRLVYSTVAYLVDPAEYLPSENHLKQAEAWWQTPNDKAYPLAAICFIQACLDRFSFPEAFQQGRLWSSHHSWTPQTENILKILFAVKKFRADTLETTETVEALGIFADQVFNLYKTYEFSGKIVTLAATILSFPEPLFWMSANLNKHFQERYQFFQKKFKKMGTSEVAEVGRRYINSHRRFYMSQRAKLGKKEIDYYLADQLSIGDSFQQKLKETFSAATAVIEEEEKVLETALAAAKNEIDSHYTAISNQNIASFRAYEAQVEAAKAQMKKKKRRGIFRAVVGIVAGIFFAPILAPKIFLGATGLGLLIGEGAILGAISAAVSKQNILKGATISAFFAGFSELFGGFLLEHLKKFKILRESLKIAAMASLQTALQSGKFIDNIISGVGAHIGAKLLSSSQRLRDPRLNLAEIAAYMKDAALHGMVTSGVLSLIRGTTVEKTVGSISMNVAGAVADSLGRMVVNESNGMATSEGLKTWFVEATESYLNRQAANASIHDKDFSESFTRRQIAVADASSGSQSQNNPPSQNNPSFHSLLQQQDQQQRRQRFPMLAAFSDAMQLQQASNKKFVADIAKRGDDFLGKCHQLLGEAAEHSGRQGEYLPQYGLKAVGIVLPHSTMEATALVLAGPVVSKGVRVVSRGAVLTHRWVIAERGANIAFKGGKYAGHIETFRTQGHRQLRKTIRSYGEQIKNHEKWLKNPQSKCECWSELHVNKQVALKYHWKEDILRLATYKEMSRRILKEKERAILMAEKMAQAAKAVRAAKAVKAAESTGSLKIIEQTGVKYAQ